MQKQLTTWDVLYIHFHYGNKWTGSWQLVTQMALGLVRAREKKKKWIFGTWDWDWGNATSFWDASLPPARFLMSQWLTQEGIHGTLWGGLINQRSARGSGLWGYSTKAEHGNNSSRHKGKGTYDMGHLWWVLKYCMYSRFTKLHHNLYQHPI